MTSISSFFTHLIVEKQSGMYFNNHPKNCFRRQLLSFIVDDVHHVLIKFHVPWKRLSYKQVADELGSILHHHIVLKSVKCLWSVDAEHKFSTLMFWIYASQQCCKNRLLKARISLSIRESALVSSPNLSAQQENHSWPLLSPLSSEHSFPCNHKSCLILTKWYFIVIHNN